MNTIHGVHTFIVSTSPNLYSIMSITDHHNVLCIQKHKKRSGPLCHHLTFLVNRSSFLKSQIEIKRCLLVDSLKKDLRLNLEHNIVFFIVSGSLVTVNPSTELVQLIRDSRSQRKKIYLYHGRNDSTTLLISLTTNFWRYVETMDHPRGPLNQ